MKIKLDARHVLSVVGVLALIGGGAAALVGTVNYFTAPIISENNDRKELEAYYDCFPDAASIGEEVAVSGAKYVKAYRAALDASNKEIGRAYIVNGKSSYNADINLIVGVNDSGLVHISLVNYGPDNTGGSATVIPAWIDSINEDTSNLENGVTTGGTATANTIREMVAEAISLYEGAEPGPGPVDPSLEKYINLFEGAASVEDEVSVSGTYVKSYREVKDASGNVLGRAYLVSGENSFTATIEFLVGITAEGEISGLYLEKYEGNIGGTQATIENWFDSVNSNPSNFETGPSASATYTTIKDAVNEAREHYGNAPVTSDEEKYLALFDGAASVGEEVAASGTYITSYREVKDASGNLLGRAYRGEGYNSYDVHIEILVGLTPEFSVSGLSLEDHSGGMPMGEEGIRDWFDDVNEDPSNLINTMPSASFSYETIMSIIKEAQKHYEEGPTINLDEYYLSLFTGASTLGKEVEVEGTYISSYREVKDSHGEVLGVGYLANGEVEKYNTNVSLIIGVNENGLARLALVDYGSSGKPGPTTDTVNNWIDSVNEDPSHLDDVDTGASYTLSLINDMIDEAVSHHLDADYDALVSNVSSWGRVIALGDTDFVTSYRTAYDENQERLARVYRGSYTQNDGSTVSVLVALDKEGKLTVGNLEMSGVDSAYEEGVKNWINKINAGTVDYREDISTSGVELAAYSLAAILDEAKESETLLLEEEGIITPTDPDTPVSANGEVMAMFPEATSWGNQVTISNVWMATDYWVAYDEEEAEIGRVYTIRLTTEAKDTLYIALNADGTFEEMKMIKNSLSLEALTEVESWITTSNASDNMPTPTGDPTSSSLSDVEKEVASYTTNVVLGIEDCQREYNLATAATMDEAIKAAVSKNFGENAQYDLLGNGSFTVDGCPEIDGNYYSIRIPASDPRGGTPTYPGNVYVAHIDEADYQATLIISVGELTDEATGVTAIVDVYGEETGTRNQDTIDRITAALIELNSGSDAA